MSAVVFMVVLGWVLVAFLGGVLIGTAIRLADEAEQPETLESERFEAWL